MLDDDLHAPKTRNTPAPSFHCLGPIGPKRRQARPVCVRVVGVDALKATGQFGCQGLDVSRIEMDMGIPARVDVAQTAVDGFWPIQNRDMSRSHDVTRLSGLDQPTRASLHEHGKPSALELGPRAEQNACTAHLRDQAGAGPDMMRILCRVRGGMDDDVAAADRFCERCPFGLACEHPQLGDCRGRKHRPRKAQGGRGGRD